MKRYKRHKFKTEIPETSTSHTREKEEHDLAYYIHDRVELMHQVFSVLKSKELKAMAPACVRNISVDDLQELCTEELLGISSKRLCAILDGAEPPSDTESSSQSATEPLETISLDSISSDEEILSQDDRSKKKKHKHRHRDSKSRQKRSNEPENEDGVDRSKASRAGLTVLELLELQARARAIRAQLQKEQIKPAAESVVAESSRSAKSQSSEDEVEIKEEPAEIVEISSDEGKPKIEELEKSNPKLKSPELQSKTVTKRVNDLVITVPQHKTQRIKLIRNKSAPLEIDTDSAIQQDVLKEKLTETINKDISKDQEKANKVKDASRSKDNAKKDKNKAKSKKKKTKRLSNASDNDEITLQLSDTEKMDLLEDLDRKNYDNVSTDTSSDSESDKDVSKKSSQKSNMPNENMVVKVSNFIDKIIDRKKRISRESRKSNDNADKTTDIKEVVSIECENVEDNIEKSQLNETSSTEIKDTESVGTDNSNSVNENINSWSTSRTDVEIVEEAKFEADINDTDTVISSEITNNNSESASENCEKTEKCQSNLNEPVDNLDNIDQPEIETLQNTKDMSEGEISDRGSSEVEAFDLKPEVVCISDEEEGKHRKKKKKKDKKSKKEKKSKKKDFRESCDQNFHKITDNSKNPIIVDSLPTGGEIILQTAVGDILQTNDTEDLQKETKDTQQINTVNIDLTTTEKSQDSSNGSKLPSDSASPNPDENQSDNDNNVVEISDEVYELSDDSSNDDEAEIRNVLSIEPTASEIEALSAKIDEIERVDVITDEEIRAYESQHKENEEVTISWKDRYLDSKKVKRVLNTSNILNALRKKNIQLKKRLEESKVESQKTSEPAGLAAGQEIQEETGEAKIAEGSLEQYNTLESSTKFVDPIKETPINDTLKKDAKQLLKMYKKLLKYNDMNKKRDPTKKKKKKKKKGKKDKEKVGDTVAEVPNT